MTNNLGFGTSRYISRRDRRAQRAKRDKASKLISHAINVIICIMLCTCIVATLYLVGVGTLPLLGGACIIFALVLCIWRVIASHSHKGIDWGV